MPGLVTVRAVLREFAMLRTGAEAAGAPPGPRARAQAWRLRAAVT